MAVPQAHLAPWTRKHDKPGTKLVPEAPVIYYPRGLEDLIEICTNRPEGQKLHAAGSHWALSTAAVSDEAFIETHDWNEVFPAMGRTLYDVVPGCLADSFFDDLNSGSKLNPAGAFYYVHVESGKRIYQMYSELDVGDEAKPDSLCGLMKTKYGNEHFVGSWGFETLGGAGGQTVVGALSTGTHGGDFDRPPVADSVVALHLVADGGKHYWIERGGPNRDHVESFTDEAKLRAVYGIDKYGGADNFVVVYDSSALAAALIQVGRFGIVYSAVMQVRRQYGLREQLVLDEWENVQGKIADPNSDLFVNVLKGVGEGVPQHFLQIGINPVPGTNGTTHQCGITRHWSLPLYATDRSMIDPVTWPNPDGNVAGRPERVGNILGGGKDDPILNAVRFSAAGNGVGYDPGNEVQGKYNVYNAACADANFLDGIVSAVFAELEMFLTTNALAAGGALAGVVAIGEGTLAALAPYVLAILAILSFFLHKLRKHGSTAGGALDELRGLLLGSSSPLPRAAGVWVWRAIANTVFTTQQAPHDYSAISYAILDTHNYMDVSCTVNVRSAEVFFDASEPSALLAFVNRLLKFESDQEFDSGLSAGGYISLRFCGRTAATIGQQMYQRTCAVECAALVDEAGGAEFVDYAVKLALDENLHGILHWGQQNDSTQAQIESRFGDTPETPYGALQQWRQVLSALTDNGRLDGFSNAFTRQTGLEIVQPVIGSFAVFTPPTTSERICTVEWDCVNNPPETTISLLVHGGGLVVPPVGGLGMSGSHVIAMPVAGSYTITLVASLERNDVARQATSTLAVAY